MQALALLTLLTQTEADATAAGAICSCSLPELLLAGLAGCVPALTQQVQPCSRSAGSIALQPLEPRYSLHGADL